MGCVDSSILVVRLRTKLFLEWSVVVCLRFRIKTDERIENVAAHVLRECNEIIKYCMVLYTLICWLNVDMVNE
jgi:hypothetical protein